MHLGKSLVTHEFNLLLLFLILLASNFLPDFNLVQKDTVFSHLSHEVIIVEKQ